MSRTLQIVKLTYGGEGFGLLDGKACFVPQTLPGDEARIRVVQDKGSYCRGEMLELLTPSGDRIAPACPVFGQCGGCDWQSLPYDRQLWWKSEIFAELLWRTARVGRDALLPIVPAPAAYGYRSRIQLKVRSVAGVLHIGFYRTGSHYVVNIPDRCPLAAPALNRVVPAVRQLLSGLAEPDRVPQVDLVAGGDGRVVVTVHYIGERHNDLRRALTEWFRSTGLVQGILLQSGRKHTLETVCGEQNLDYQVNGISGVHTLGFTAGGFSQVNYDVNRSLVGLALEEAGSKPRGSVLDLYCGNGNFSVPLADRCISLTGIEDNPLSVRDARRNADRAGFSAAHFVQGDAVAAVRGLCTEGRIFDLVILDPPRSGARDLVSLLPGLQPNTIIYISCDPATLARDLAILQKRGYAVTGARPVDMFPQTYHMESITVLTRTGQN